jgi:hypothetical protein
VISDILSIKAVQYVTFNEPDMGATNTAIATEVLKEHQKRFLKRYKKLEM